MIKEFLNTDRLTLGIGKILAKVIPEPNIWTAISFLPAVLGFYFVYKNQVIWGVIFFALAGIFDSFDGSVARVQGRSTYLGAYLDGVTDRFVDFLIVFSFLFLKLPNFIFSINWWIVICAYFALMPTFTVAYSNHRRAVEDPYEKVIWRILHRSEMYPLFLITLFIYIYSPAFATYLLVLTTILSIITTFQTIILTIIKSKNYPQQKD